MTAIAWPTVVPWLVLALMTIFALVIVLRPLMRRTQDASASRRATNIHIYRERIAELEAEHRYGRIDPEQMQLQKDELGRRLLDEVDESPAAAPASGRAWWMSLLLLLAIPALAFGLYWNEGSWQSFSVSTAQTRDLPFLAERLEARVQTHPQDAQAWALLGRARRALNEPGRAAQAFKKANSLTEPASIELLVEEAEATALAANGDLTGRPAMLFEKVLAREPEHVEALWLLGLAARQAGEPENARNYWVRLLQLELPAEFAQTVREQLQNLPAQ